MDEELLTVGECARVLRVDTTTVRRWIGWGVLDAVALPHAHKRRQYRIRRSTIEAMLNSTVVPVAQ